MAVLSEKAFDELTRFESSSCVSIFFPFDARHRNDRRDHVLLKTLIASARVRLENLRRPEVDAILAPAEEVLKRPAIGQHSGTICLFCAPGFAREIELDHVLDPLAVVGHRFEVARLLPALGHGESFYVLTVGAENVGMSVVNDFGWDACDVPDLPKSIEEGLWFEKIDRTSTTHGATRGEGGRRTIHHGKGAQNEDRKRRMGRFLRLVDDRVVAYLASASSPLIVTGTAPVVAMYEQVTRYANVVPVPIGSPEEITPSELHQKIDLVIDAEISHQNDQIVAHFASLMGTGRASGDLTELLSAAETGRVATVLVASTAPVWVRAGQPENVLPEWEEGSEDLVNRVVVEASRRGAEVRVVDSLPRELTVAGIFRH